MSGMPTATLRLISPNASVVAGSLAPEVGREIPRTQVRMETAPGEITLHVQASDVSALRAAINSYLRWMKISEDVGNMAGEIDG